VRTGRLVQTCLPRDVLRRISALFSVMKRKDRSLTRSAFLRQLLTRGLDERVAHQLDGEPGEEGPALRPGPRR
jgi:hypothetical protein